MNNIPCGHAVAFINKVRRQPRDYIPAVFSLASYQETYSAVNLLPTDTSELPESGECRPPLLRKPRGRPKEKRLRKGERRRKYLKRRQRERQHRQGRQQLQRVNYQQSYQLVVDRRKGVVSVEEWAITELPV